MAEDKDAPIAYLQRTREYYLGLGYDNPYEWAYFDNVPFTKLSKPISEGTHSYYCDSCTRFNLIRAIKGPGAPYNGAAKFFSVYQLPIQPEPDLRISHIAIDRAHTSAKDSRTYLPLAAMQRAHKIGAKLARLLANLYGFPTNRSQRTNIEIDAPELVRRLQHDEIDAIIAVPNCPICHQSVSIAARAAEEAGIPTVIMGCARDIVEHVGVSRFYFSDFPLGQ